MVIAANDTGVGDAGEAGDVCFAIFIYKKNWSLGKKKT